ncbi:MAG: hypothetical protein ABIQ82_12100 [Variovorax sp.]
MSNPWTKKNPLLSMWLSAGNKSVGVARGQVTAAAKRQVASAQADMTRQILDAWSGKAPRAPAKKKRR